MYGCAVCYRLNSDCLRAGLFDSFCSFAFCVSDCDGGLIKREVRCLLYNSLSRHVFMLAVSIVSSYGHASLVKRIANKILRPGRGRSNHNPGKLMLARRLYGHCDGYFIAHAFVKRIPYRGCNYSFRCVAPCCLSRIVCDCPEVCCVADNRRLAARCHCRADSQLRKLFLHCRLRRAKVYFQCSRRYC